MVCISNPFIPHIWFSDFSVYKNHLGCMAKDFDSATAQLQEADGVKSAPHF